MVRRGKIVTSIRIVSVDHYMHKPEPRFDTCYSEFRGSDVKQVPVIRLFGSTADGTHSCVHIHGVFPYLYVPYDGSTTDRIAVDRLMYQMAASLDKAINVSLGNVNSTATHVFRIALVKGIPIYGYHRKEHQFLKIYLYNPFLIRKANNLLKDGVILSRVFQTFESHVSYILQFFIDFNLYGMSFLDVPDCAIWHRSDNGARGLLKKMSTSKYEIDILAVDILNRNSMEDAKRSEYANPGLATVWNDEKARRLLGMQQPQALSLSHSGRIETGSDRFYRSVLASKLTGGNGSSRSEDGKDRQMRPLVSIYPSEVADDEQLLDASCVRDHKYFTHYSSFNQSNTVYDFKTNLAKRNHEFLDSMRELEKNEGHQGDSLLVPLTKQNERRFASSGKIGINLSQSSNKRLNTTLSRDLEMLLLMGTKKEGDHTMQMEAKTSDLLNASDDDILNSTAIPQLDGAHDGELPKRTSRNGTSPIVNCNGVKINGLSEPVAKRLKSAEEAKLTNGFDVTKEVITNGVHKGNPSLKPKKLKLSLPDCPEKMTNRLANGVHLGFKLKECKIRIQRCECNEIQTEPQVQKLKELKVKLSMVDISAYRLPARESPIKETSKRTRDSPATERDLSPFDEFRLAREYDLVNNWDPQEGLSRGPVRRGRRRRGRDRGRKGRASNRSPTPEPEPEPESEIDEVRSQKFQNIIKRSPKVLITALNQQEVTDLRTRKEDHLPMEPRGSAAKRRPSISEPEPEIDEVRSQKFQNIIKRSPKVLITVLNHQEVTDLRAKNEEHLPMVPKGRAAKRPPTSESEPESEPEIDVVRSQKFQNIIKRSPKVLITALSQQGVTDLRTRNEEHLPMVPRERAAKRPPTSEPEPEPEPEIDVVRSQKFHNIIKLSPKVLITALSQQGVTDLQTRNEEHLPMVPRERAAKRLPTSEPEPEPEPEIDVVRSQKFQNIVKLSPKVLITALGQQKVTELRTRNEEHLLTEPIVSSSESDAVLITNEESRSSSEQRFPKQSEISQEAAGVALHSPVSEKAGDGEGCEEDDEDLNIKSIYGQTTIDDFDDLGSESDGSMMEQGHDTASENGTTLTSALLSSTYSPSAPYDMDRLELSSYSARWKQRSTPKARLSLSAAFKRFGDSRFEEVEPPKDGEVCDAITPGQDTASHLNIEEGLDVMNSSQLVSASQKSDHSDSGSSDQSTLPHSEEIASIKQRLLTWSPRVAPDDSQHGDPSGNISATTPNNNTYGSNVNFENLQKAKASCEVAAPYCRQREYIDQNKTVGPNVSWRESLVETIVLEIDLRDDL